MGEPSSPPSRLDRRLWTLLFVLSGNMVLDAVEVSIVLLALPSVGRELGMSLWTAQWLMSGFALGFAVLLVLGPVLVGRWGRRPVYLAAMLVFAIASVVGGLADSTALLIASRVVKGACAAMTAPAGLAVISTSFADGPLQRRAVAIYSLFGAAGFTLGLLLSGALADGGWRWTLLFPGPVALVLLVLGLSVIPDTPKGSAPPPIGAVLRDRALLRSTAGAAALNGGYIGLLLLFTTQAADLFDWSPWQTALALLPASVPLVVSVPFAGRLVRRFGTRRLIATGAAAALAGQLVYLLVPRPDSYLAGPLPALLLVETAFVLSFAALHMQATSTVEPSLRAGAVPVYQTGVQLGAAVLLPLVAALITVGYQAALLVIATTGALGLTAATVGGRSRRQVGSDRPPGDDRVEHPFQR